MGLFSANYNRPGPGVPKDAPQKKGFARFFEILGRDMGNLFKVNLMFSVCCIPMLLVCGWLIVTLYVYEQLYLGFILIFVPLFTLSGILVGPAMASMQAVLTNMLRDEPDYVWTTFKRKFKQNFKPAAMLGIIFSFVFSMELVAGVFYISANLSAPNILLIALYMFNIFIVVSISIFAFLQVVYLDLKNFAIIKNSLLLTFGMAKRGLPATIITTVLTGATILYVPITVPFFFLGIPVLIMLIADMWVWPVMEKTFNISELLNKRREEEYFSEPIISIKDSNSEHL